MTSETRIPEFEGWAVVELMGHRRLAGYVREASAFGTALLRLDVPGAGAPNDGVHDVFATQYYGGGSIYAVTPCTEEIARSIAQRTRETPEPVAYALPTLKRCEIAFRFVTPCSPDMKTWSPPEDGTGDLRDVLACGRHVLEWKADDREPSSERHGFTHGPIREVDEGDFVPDPRD